MTTTTTAIPTQASASRAGEIQIIRTPPTLADAQLIVQMQIANAISGASDGYTVLAEFETPPTLGQLRKRHPRESVAYGQVQAFLMSCETHATFVRHGLLNEELVNDLYAVPHAWALVEKLVKGIRRETRDPRQYEQFEWLARRANG